MTTPPTVRRAVCRVLALAEPHPLPQAQLLAQVNELLRPQISKDELKENLSWLLDHFMVDFIADPMDPDNVDGREWLIKTPGLAVLKK